MILLQDVPSGYEYCFAGKDKCPRATTCLHALAAQLLTESEAAQPQSIRVINPCYIDRLAEPSACTSYRSSEMLRYARGMSHLFDDVPLKQAATLRSRVMRCFSCERYYYHCRKGDRLITPNEQQHIAQVFKSAGIAAAPKFDAYEYGLCW